jgi:hypothetical protein
MRQWQRWMLAGAISLGLAACGGGGEAESPAPPPPSGGAPQPVLETGRASSVAIGAAGGVLNVTAANGISYQLEIPQGALPGPVQITMTPVSSIGNLPLSGGLVGAVELQPSGLRFARTAQLRIGVAAPSRPGLTLAGFSIESGGARAARSLAVSRGDEVLMLIGHFSTHGAGYGSAEDLTSLTHVAGDLTALEQDIGLEVTHILFRADLEPAELVRGAYLGWFDNIVLPLTRRADNDELLLGAAAVYQTWKSFAQLLSPTDPVAVALEAAMRPVASEVAARQLDWANLAGPKFRAAIVANNELCKAQGSLAALRNVLFLQSTAQPLIDESALHAHIIDRNAVLRELCARMIFTAGPTLTDPLRSTVASDLDMTFALKFDDLPEEQAVPVQVVFSGINAAFAKASPANSNVQGEFTLGVAAVDSSEPVTISLQGCLVLDAEVTDVCIGETLARNGNQEVGRVQHESEGRVATFLSDNSADRCPTDLRSPVGATAWTESQSCTVDLATSSVTTSFTESVAGGQLGQVTASGAASVTGPTVGGRRAVGAGSAYELTLFVAEPTQATIQAQVANDSPTQCFSQFFFSGLGLELTNSGELTRTLVLAPGSYRVGIRADCVLQASASGPGNATYSFNLTLPTPP